MEIIRPQWDGIQLCQALLNIPHRGPEIFVIQQRCLIFAYDMTYFHDHFSLKVILILCFV